MENYKTLNFTAHSCFIRTTRGVIPRNILKPISRGDGSGTDILPTDTGSRVGVFFLPTRNESDKAEMHFIINDEDQGPSTKNIPYKEGTLLHAVVDVYGTTKQVKIVQLYGGSKFIIIIFFINQTG